MLVHEKIKEEASQIVEAVAEYVQWEGVLSGRGLAVHVRAAHTTQPADKVRHLSLLAAEAAACTACELHRQRTHSVFARGNPESRLVFVGEGPGYHEDQKGLPFVGPAGQLLDKMIVAMGLSAEEVYICNVVKCRPPENRTPLPVESATCKRFLDAQLLTVRPEVVVALGRCAAEALGCLQEGSRSWRGAWTEYQGLSVLGTYHPAFLLRNPEHKRTVWEDLQKVMARLQLPKS